MIPQLKSIFNTNQVTSLINLLTKNVNNLIAGKEDVANKQDNLNVDGTGTKYPTVDAINTEVTLDYVLGNGNTSQLDAGIRYLNLYDAVNDAYGQINLTDNILEATNASGDSIITIEGSTIVLNSNTILESNLVTTAKTFTFPNKNGTFAMTSDVSTAESNANSYTNGVAATKQDIFTYEGTGSGTTAVTIDGYKSGVATFTQVITRKTTQSFRINSVDIGATSKVIPVLVYDGAGSPFILSQKVASGRVDLLVANIAVDGGSGADTNASILIEYQIIG